MEVTILETATPTTRVVAALVADLHLVAAALSADPHIAATLLTDPHILAALSAMEEAVLVDHLLSAAADLLLVALEKHTQEIINIICR